MDMNVELDAKIITDKENTALTTSDNPYSPFTQFTQWYHYDQNMQYYTCSLLARVVDELSEKYKDLDENELENLAIFQIVKMNLVARPDVSYKIVKEKEK